MSDHIVEIKIKTDGESEEQTVRYDFDDISDIYRIILEAFGYNLGCEESHVDLADQDAEVEIWDALRPIVEADFSSDLVEKCAEVSHNFKTGNNGYPSDIAYFINEMSDENVELLPKEL